MTRTSVFAKLQTWPAFKAILTSDSNWLVYKRNLVADRFYKYAGAMLIARKAIGLMDKEIARRDLPRQPIVSHKLRAQDRAEVMEVVDRLTKEGKWWKWWQPKEK